MARTRTTKKLAQRIDLNYFKRPTPLKRAKFWLSFLLPALALAWIAWHILVRDHRVYSSGRLSEPHAVFEKECATCHVRQAGQFSAEVADSACLDCHDGPVHHTSSTTQRDCIDCHVEHRGRISLSSVSNESCAHCHARLVTDRWGHIESFEASHPQFAALQEGSHDPGTIKLNHAIHMKPIRRGPNGPNVQLECGNCHRSTAAGADLTFALPEYLAAAAGYDDKDEFLSIRTDALKPLRPMSGRELMAPVKFANACAACHLLTFDKRFEEGVPHDKPEIVHVFVVQKFIAYIAAHPGELREMQDPDRALTGRPRPPRTRAVTASQWVAEKTAVAEELLWRKTCAQCHEMSLTPLRDASIARWSTSNPNGATHIASASQAESSVDQATHFIIRETKVPAVAPANITLRWMPHAKFDHSAHEGFTCVSCHAKALTSAEATDILLPGVATCKTCHAPGPEHAESRCFECHTYHDWSKRKEITPKFTMPALRTGGRGQ